MRKTKEWKIYWNWHVAFLVMSIEVLVKDFIECSKPRTALLFLGVRWNLIFRFGSLPQALHDMSVCWLKLATRPVLQRPKWITWQGSKRATILEHQKDRSFDNFGEQWGYNDLSLWAEMLAAVCNMQGLWVFVGLWWESWRGVFCVFFLVSLIGQIVTVNLTVNLLWVVVVLLLVVVLWIGRHVIQPQSAHSDETMHFYAASPWLSSLACLVPGVRRWPERCLVAIEEWYRRRCCQIQTLTLMDVCERMQANRPAGRIMKSLLAFLRGIPVWQQSLFPVSV